MAILETCEDDPPHHAQLSNKTSQVPFRTQEPSFGLIVRVYSVTFLFAYGIWPFFSELRIVESRGAVLKLQHGISSIESPVGPRSNVGSNATENDVSNVLVDSLSLWSFVKQKCVIWLKHNPDAVLKQDITCLLRKRIFSSL